MVKIALIEIVEVDTETVEKDDSFPKAFSFYIRLSDKPNHIWKEYFEDEFRNAFYGLKREITVVKGYLRLVFGEGENIESHIKFARQLVESTNERVKKHNQQMELEEKQKKAQEEQIEEKKEEIRKKLRGIG